MNSPIPGEAKPAGRVLNIQHFCTHDGPGIRTTVFLKGCSLRCKWCCNPESIHPKSELAFDFKKCIGEKECGWCLKACPENAINFVDTDGTVRINWDLCTNCGKCVPVCPPEALYEFGRDMTVDEVLAEVEQDAVFYRQSGGGITLSGGECMLQPEFSIALFAEAHRRGINTTIETTGNAPWDVFRRVLEHADTILHDHKLSDPALHKRWTGVDNVRIKANYQRAYEAFPTKTFIARTPVIPGVNDDEEHIRTVLAFIKPYKNVVDYQLLPYHRYGETKYGFLGRAYALKDFPPLPAETLHRLRAIIDEAFGRTGTAKAT
jgi:pyruvate formate lyase activating enzyme